MKATLEFNLPEEREEFETSVNAYRYKSALWELDNYLRGKIKHAPDDMHDEFLNALKMVRNELHELTENLTIWIQNN